MRIDYDKLVRDKIPEIIQADGKSVDYEVMNSDIYRVKLAEKLCEEAAEFQKDSNIEELADILEVFYAILKANGITFEEVEKARKEKAEKNGTFDKMYLLKGVNW